MQVELKKLRPNPLRDFRIDPLEDEDPEILDSINDTGFWGGVPVRQTQDGRFEIAAGHRRIHNAIKAGIKYADLDVRERDDYEMIRIYATENLTQRGEKNGLAMAGAVASAARYLIKAILKGDKDSVRQICPTEKNGTGGDFEHLQANVTSEKGIGWRVILAFYKNNEAAFKESIVKHHLTNLKASGDYARIVKEVTEEIEKEHQAELKELNRQQREAEAARKADEAALAKAEKEKAKAEHAKTTEKAEKAVTAAEEKTPWFDLTGVGKHLKTEHQIRVFREVMKRPAVQKYLPVNKQAAYAAELVRVAKKLDVELNAQFIDDHTTALVMEAASEQGKINRTEKRDIEAENVKAKWANLSHNFCRNLNRAMREAADLVKLKDKHPKLEFTKTQELIDAVRFIRPKINELAEKLRIYP